MKKSVQSFLRRQWIVYLLLIPLIGLISCKPTINYLGSKYPPTTHVDVYFDENDIERSYKVIGRMKNEGGELELSEPEEIQRAMIEKAKSVGADAILYHGIYQEKILGESTEINTSSNRNKESTSIYAAKHSSKIYEVSLIKYDDQ